MNKGDLINEVAKVVGSKKEAQAAVDCVIATITGALAERDPVTLVGFGTFSSEYRKSRMGRNPKTREEIPIPEKIVVKFKPGKDLAIAVDTLELIEKRRK